MLTNGLYLAGGLMFSQRWNVRGARAALPNFCALVALASMLPCAALLGGCAGNSQSVAQGVADTQSVSPMATAMVADDGAAPLKLTAELAPSAATPMEMSIADAQIGPAISLYRFNAKLPAGGALKSGADLNGDGVAEALVLLTDGACLTTTGCPLVVFQMTPVGFRPVSRTIAVRPPVRGGAGASGGWRDIIVNGADGRARLLRFNADGYPATTAAAELELPGAVSEMLISATDPSLTPAGSRPAQSAQLAGQLSGQLSGQSASKPAPASFWVPAGGDA